MKTKSLQEVDLSSIIAVNDRWWRGELGRPVFNIACAGAGPTLPVSKLEPRSFIPEYPRDASPADIIDAEYFKLSRRRYIGDGFPLQWMNFGPGVLAALVGGTGHAGKDTVWFEPGQFAGLPLSGMRMAFDPRSDWALWLTELYHEQLSRLDRQPLIPGMTDLGGVLDILATLRGSEALMLDLLDEPGEVSRLTGEEWAARASAYDYFNTMIRARARVSSCWAGLLSSATCDMLQSDFSYMISPAMFCEFVRPRLVESCARLAHPFYHLDGKGELPHLPHLLTIPGLRGIQWVPGAGQPPQSEWPEVFEAVEAAGLKMQLLGTLDSCETVLRRLKNPSLAHVWLEIRPHELERAVRLVAEFGGA
jgi:5-methyltetrahydrofolate--homocysteine methyltransferase